MDRESAPSYFAMPNRDYTPDGLINLGQIISKFDEPTRPICKRLEPLPKVYPSYATDWEIELSQIFSFTGGIFSNVPTTTLNIGGSLASGLAKEAEITLKCQRMDTYVIEPTDYIDDSIAMDAIQDFLRRNPKIDSLFMITGIKVARGAECAVKGSKNLDAEANMGVDLTAAGIPLSIGPEASGKKYTLHRETFSGSSDFVFAYSLRRLFRPDKAGQIISKKYTKGASVLMDTVSSREIAQADVDLESPSEDEPNSGGVFKLRSVKVDFASDFVPPGFQSVEVEDETGGACRIIFQRVDRASLAT